MSIPVVRGVRDVVSQATHAGLLLDKYASYDGVLRWEDLGETREWKFTERVQKPTINRVVGLKPPEQSELDWAGLSARQAAMLKATGAEPWDMATAGPLTLHLSRASALENAGLCLHRVYGFALLPGTGLKGMARSYAETVWLPAQTETDRPAAAEMIRRVFGHLKEKDDASGRAGAVVFHDGWPVEWPRLVPDILNNHHKGYYGGKGAEAPGDWDEPNMVSFLAVRPGTAFRFAVAGRRQDTDETLVAQAREWLTLALLDEGAGAKTAAGYGGFRMADPKAAEPARPKESAARRSFTADLELVTPAFLAGPNQQQDDCELRPATLRGQLRWWWRTLHAGFVDVPTLRRLEAAVWGDTGAGGAVRVTVEPLGPVAPVLFDRAAVIRDQKLPKPSAAVAAQGLIYASYGMNEKSKPPRWFISPSSKWRVRLAARPGRYAERDRRGSVGREQPLTADQVLGQARAALALLCHLGGVGSKSRNGFGSFADLPGTSLPDLKRAAAEFRRACGVDRPFRSADAGSLALEEVVPPPKDARLWLEVVTPWRDPWLALDRIGATMQAFSQTKAHDPAKLALGLPRQIHGPRREPLDHQRGRRHDPPQSLRGNPPVGNRHAAPVFYHLAKPGGGPLTVRVTAMTAHSLPDATASKAMLTELVAFLQTQFAQEVAAHAGGGAGHRPVRPTGPTKRAAGKPARVTILGRRPKGGYDVQEVGRPAGTLTVGNPPADLAGEVDVQVHNDDPSKPQYKWPAAAPPKAKPR